MKVFIVLAAFVAVVSASGYGPEQTGHAAPIVTTGHSTQYRSEDNYGNFQFGYDESHATGGSSRREEETNGVRRGSYSLNDIDGRRRTVNFIADHTGFHANVQTNEPGVEPKDPANVAINKHGYNTIAVPSQAPVAAAAPVLEAPIAAPVYSSNPAPVHEGVAPEAAAFDTQAPSAFSYSFGSSHISPVAYEQATPAAVAEPTYGASQAY